VDEVARALLTGIRAGTVVCTLLKQHEFRAQAAVALSWCVEHFGDFSDPQALKRWRHGAKLSAAEQVDRLRVITGDLELETLR
jgi:hypothetical protein